MLKLFLTDPIYYCEFNEALNKLIREGKVLRKEIDGVPCLKLKEEEKEAQPKEEKGAKPT
jgi:hypothetical protein